MKIGFVVSFFDFRNDVRRLITEVLRNHPVVLFTSPSQVQLIKDHAPAGCEIRIIQERTNSLNGKFVRSRYRVARAIPASKQNFYLMESFKTGRLTGKKKIVAEAVTKLHRFLPNNYDYDAYLNDLRYSGETELHDIDGFVCFTEIADDYFMARMVRESFPLLTYVYSWDHPCKHTRFSRRSDHLAWNEGIKEDLIELQYIPEDKIKITGASQFCYIHEYLHQYREESSSMFDFKYVYFGCAIGIETLVPDEVDQIIKLADTLQATRPDLKLVVRPYPPLKNWSLYDRLYAHPAVVMDDDFRRKDRAVSQSSLMEKFIKLDHAEAFFHLGTTLGLECCFLSTPSFILDTSSASRDHVSVYNFTHQYQNDKYLMAAAPENHCKDWKQAASILADTSNPRYLRLNALVRKNNKIQSFQDLAIALSGFLESQVKRRGE